MHFGGYMIIDKYKSIIVDENKSGDITLLPKHNSDIMTEIIPDALEYVKNHCFKFKKGTYLSGLNGVDIEIFPDSNLNNLIDYWKEEYYSESGICIES